MFVRCATLSWKMRALNADPLFAGRNEITVQLRPGSATKRGRKVIHAHA